MWWGERGQAGGSSARKVPREPSVGPTAFNTADRPEATLEGRVRALHRDHSGAGGGKRCWRARRRI